MRSSFKVLHDTSLFDSHQMQPRAILQIGMRSWASTIKAHLKSFPKLLTEDHFGVAVLGARIRYLEPHNFFTGDEFQVSAQTELVNKRTVIWGQAFLNNGRHDFASLELIVCPLRLEDGQWAASPEPVGPPVLDYFPPDGVTKRIVSWRLKPQLAGLGKCDLVKTTTVQHRIYRHDCEAADQWSYIEAGAFAASAREKLLLELGDEADEYPELRTLLNRPIAKIDLQFFRPLYLYDDFTIETELRRGPQEITFIHRFRSQMGGEHEHAVVIEAFENPVPATGVQAKLAGAEAAIR